MENEQKIAAIYTGAALVKPLSDLLRQELPGVKVMNILDDSLIAETIEHGRPTPAVKRRLLAYYGAAFDAGARLILNTCSSIGEVVYSARDFFPIPIVRIDDAMAREAVQKTDRIGVLATLPTTLGPTLRLVEKWAAAEGKTVTTVSGLAEGAFDAITRGDAETHDRLIAETAEKIAPACEYILLAQATMARMEERLRRATGRTVLSSPRSGIAMVKAILAGNQGLGV